MTGGSQTDPFTMSDLDADGTVGQYITPCGYGLREYAVSKALVIGSDAGDTFFDLSNSIITMNAGVTLTVYTTALRGGGMGPTFAAKASDKGVIPFMDDTVKGARIESVKKLYIERVYYLDNNSGVWTRLSTAPRVVAVAEDATIAEGPYS